MEEKIGIDWDLIAGVVMGIVIFVVFLTDGDSGMVIETLSHQLQGQRVLVTGGLLDLSALVLEPDFDLILVQLQLVGQFLSPFLVQVAVLGEFRFEPRQLLRRERRPRPLLLRRFGAAAADATAAAAATRRRTFLFHSSRSRTCFNAIILLVFLCLEIDGTIDFQVCWSAVIFAALVRVSASAGTTLLRTIFRAVFQLIYI